MSLQQRLTLLIVVIVMLPLSAAGFLLRDTVVGEVRRREESRLRSTLAVADSMLVARAKRVGVLLGPVSKRLRRYPAEGPGSQLETLLKRVLARTEELDFLIALDRSGEVVAASATEPDFASGFKPPAMVKIAGEGTLPGIAEHRVAVGGRNGSVDRLIGGFWTDRDFLQEASAGDIGLALLKENETLATTGPVPNLFSPQKEDSVHVRIRALRGGVSAVAWYSADRLSGLSQRVLYFLLALLAVALVVVAALSHWLSRLLTKPLTEVSRGAEAIAQGRFEYRIPIRTGDEVGQLAASFNAMAAKLGTTVEELSSSRDLLQRTVQRVGETLRSTHDMRSILESILNTAADAVGADVGVIWGFSASHGELYPIVVRDARVDGLGRVSVGSGIVGLVAERGVTVVRDGSEEGPQPAASEPRFPVSMAIPLYSQQRIHSVLTVYRRDARSPFEQADMEAVKFLADQGRVALENVQLHEEAQRLSITDGLTGVWNRRFLQMQFRSMHATSMRFNRPFSLLMLDLDHFKDVNDSSGHQRGDAVLIEFAQRVSDAVREVDVVARYGGEEFVCLLSETDLSGAVVTAEKILEEVRSESFGGAGERPIALTVSAGVASFPQHGDSFRTLVAAADRGLYRAKQEGRDRIGLPEGPAGLKVAR
ncbi:MAG: diguanylate cyclase [Actinomycetota bacterium]|nr:diguanylate cyclase [Actinomycetota bacterium]